MTPLAALIRRLPPDPRPDGALVAAFLADRDEAAFAELVRRHGPLVWAACRRRLPDPTDADDAFQATFLVLVRRAAGLTGAGDLGPWLYKVAALTAGKARRRNARRLARLAPLPADLPAPAPAPPAGLDDALLRLPERYRATLVLCFLEGLTHREAAARLGCPAGTVSSLVARGLARLRSRLAGRDPATLLAAAAAGSVPEPLAAAAVRSAAALRLTSPSAAAPPAVARLTEGVLRMFWVKKATAAGLTAVLLVAAGFAVGLATRQDPGAVAQGPTPPGKKGDGTASAGGVNPAAAKAAAPAPPAAAKPLKPSDDPELDMAIESPQSFMFVEQVTTKTATDGPSYDLVITSVRPRTGVRYEGGRHLVYVPPGSMRVFRADPDRDEFTRQGGVYWRCGGAQGKVQFKTPGALVLVVRQNDGTVHWYTLALDLRC